MPDAREPARRRFFDELRGAIAEYYLAEPGNPYRQSGRSRGAERWEESRRCIADAVDRDGDFMDIGCANGLLLETLGGWLAERSIAIRPHGIDFVPELVQLARERHRDHVNSFDVANAWDWQPRRRYDFVRANLDSVPDDDRGEFARRLYDRAVAPGGRLIVCEYRSGAEGPPAEIADELAPYGFAVAGRSGCPGTSLAWVEKPRE